MVKAPPEERARSTSVLPRMAMRLTPMATSAPMNMAWTGV